jgi:hypothetical protein
VSDDKKDLGSTSDIDYRTRVGSDKWNENNTAKAKKLSAWRRLHALLPHDQVKEVANLEMSGRKLAQVAERVEAEQKKEKK